MPAKRPRRLRWLIDSLVRLNSTLNTDFERHTNMAKTLSEILHEGERERLATSWQTTEAAEEFTPLPGNTYIARIIGGELTQSRTNATPGYKLTFKVLEGEHQDRQFWHDVWLTEPGLPMANRDLGKLGVKTMDQLDSPLPPGIRCKVKLVLRRDDDGTEYNRVRGFEVIGIDPPEHDAFAPAANNSDAESAEEPDERPDVADDEMDAAAQAALDGDRIEPGSLMPGPADIKGGSGDG